MPRNARQLACQFEGCLATSARLIDRVIASAYDEALCPTGVRSTQVTMLAAIGGAEHPSASDLIDVLRMDQTTVSRNIDRLERRGLVRKLGADDRRVAPLELTGEGRRTLERALPIWRAAQKRTAELLGARFSSELALVAGRLSGGIG